MPIVVTHTEFAALLRRRNVTQIAFAKLAGVTAMAVNHWCRGRYAVPQWAVALANALDQTTAATLSKLPPLSWHEVLGVPFDAKLPAVSLACARLAKLYHPDAGGNTAAMQRINAAYDFAKRVIGKDA